MKRKGFTLIELLAVIGIISLLVAIVMPAISKVQRTAKEAACRAKLNAIGQGLEAFRNDHGFYPDSSERYDRVTGNPYALGLMSEKFFGVMESGAHRLTEAMFGIDMLGYANNGHYEIGADGQPVGSQRTRYLDSDNMDVFNPRTNSSITLEQLGLAPGSLINGNVNPLILDGLHIHRPQPILYYKAKRSAALIGDIYNVRDNQGFTVNNGFEWSNRYPSTIRNGQDYPYNFERMILDPTTGQVEDIWQDEKDEPGYGDILSPQNYLYARPYNREGYLLISPGFDGIYGTRDDISNFPLK